jgi:hypothetical protein
MQAGLDTMYTECLIAQVDAINLNFVVFALKRVAPDVQGRECNSSFHSDGDIHCPETFSPRLLPRRVLMNRAKSFRARRHKSSRRAKCLMKFFFLSLRPDLVTLK